MRTYGEAVFDIAYLLLTIVLGILIIILRKDRQHLLMGLAALILGCGDAFHLVPRILSSFVGADLSAWLGYGKLVTSVTMTLFYVLVYRIYLGTEGVREHKGLSACIYALTVIRCALCLWPDNHWLENDGSLMWGIIRNVPFVIMGIVMIVLLFRVRHYAEWGYVWLWVLLSFAFYIPVVVGASAVPMLGMLMLPKTVCYVLIIIKFYRNVRNNV